MRMLEVGTPFLIFLMGTMFSGAYYRAKGADFRLTQRAQLNGLF